MFRSGGESYRAVRLVGTASGPVARVAPVVTAVRGALSPATLSFLKIALVAAVLLLISLAIAWAYPSITWYTPVTTPDWGLATPAARTIIRTYGWLT